MPVATSAPSIVDNNCKLITSLLIKRLSFKASAVLFPAKSQKYLNVMTRAFTNNKVTCPKWSTFLAPRLQRILKTIDQMALCVLISVMLERAISGLTCSVLCGIYGFGLVSVILERAISGLREATCAASKTSKAPTHDTLLFISLYSMAKLS